MQIIDYFTILTGKTVASNAIQEYSKRKYFMMQNKFRFICLYYTIFAVICLLFISYNVFPQKKLQKYSFKPDASIPIDPNVTIGKLNNGITYYIRTNKRPEKRAELRLVINAGSVLEDDDQLGLAHFLEHMAFNGTKNFKKLDLVNYLESIGMRFGPDLNAYTSFDETVYMLTIPTDSAEIVMKAFQVLEDWAHQISLNDEDIDGERYVVIEEWRLGRGADARMLDKQLPILFKNSRYADRLPIGKKDILESFEYETLRNFYKTWYRPDLMAVIAVGDFDKTFIEQLIKKHFQKISSPEKVIKRNLYPVPDHDDLLFAVATDPEATTSRVGIYFKHPVKIQNTIRDLRNDIVEGLFTNLFNNRLRELTKVPDPPFIFAVTFSGSFVRTKDVYVLQAVVRENGIKRGLENLLREAERIRQHGFTQTELEREKKEFLRQIEKQYNERDKTESRVFASQYVNHYLTGKPIPGIEFGYEYSKQFVPQITLAEINEYANKLITENNRVVMVNAPRKEGIITPTEAELLSVFEKISKEEILAYEDGLTYKSLMPGPPVPATIIEKIEVNELGVTVWRLSNGVRVILKPTDFKNDEVLMTAYSPGGTSLVDDNDFTSATMASTIIKESGIGNFNQIELEKLLKGKIVSVNPYIGELEEGISGSASPDDLETLFQLIYLYFTSPRKDSTAFIAYTDRMKGILENRSAQPEVVFEDTIQVTVSQYHNRRRPFTKETLKEINLEKSLSTYRDRFADASDFTFIFVGAFQLDNIQPLVKSYLGGLPSKQRNEKWKDLGISPPNNVIKKSVIKGIEPKSQVRIIFTGPFHWSPENRFKFQSMISVLRIKLREVLREELGGVYGVGIGGSTVQYPKSEYRITISFGCAPERVNELITATMNQIDSLKVYGTTEVYLNKVKEIQRRERETNLKENRFWLSSLQFYYSNQEDPLDMLKYFDRIQNLSLNDIKSAAEQYFNLNQYIQVVLYPEKE